MTLTIIFGVLIVLELVYIIICFIKGVYINKTGLFYAYIFLLIVLIVILSFNLGVWHSSKAESTALYHQLLSEKAIMEETMDTAKDMDRLLLKREIDRYNNRIIKARTNADRFILRDYYNQDLDWAALELIEWR